MSAAGYLVAATPLRTASAGSLVGLPILAVSETGDAALGGALIAAMLGPSVVAAPLVGLLLDRARHPRRLLLASSVVTAGALAGTASLGTVPLPVIAIALVLAGFMNPFFFGGISSFAPDEIADERRAYAVDALAYNVGAVAGPALTALVAAFSPYVAMLTLGGLAAIGGLGTFATRLSRRSSSAEHPARAVLNGLRRLVTHRPLAVITLASTLAYTTNGALPVVAVVLAATRFDSPDQGSWIVIAFAIGGLAGAILYAGTRKIVPDIVVMASGFVVAGLAMVVAAIDVGPALPVAMAALAGLFNSPGTAAMMLLRKQQSPPRMRSQIFTVAAGLRTGAAAGGAAVAGSLTGLDPGLLIALVGGVWIASALVLLAYPRGTVPTTDS